MTQSKLARSYIEKAYKRRRAEEYSRADAERAIEDALFVLRSAQRLMGEK